MPQLLYSPGANDLLNQLEADPTEARLLAVIDKALAKLESTPGDEECRRLSFPNEGLWGMVVVARDGVPWWVLWRPATRDEVPLPEDARNDDAVIVVAIAPAPQNWKQ